MAHSVLRWANQLPETESGMSQGRGTPPPWHMQCSNFWVPPINANLSCKQNGSPAIAVLCLVSSVTFPFIRSNRIEFYFFRSRSVHGTETATDERKRNAGNQALILLRSITTAHCFGGETMMMYQSQSLTTPFSAGGVDDRGWRERERCACVPQ